MLSRHFRPAARLTNATAWPVPRRCDVAVTIASTPSTSRHTLPSTQRSAHTNRRPTVPRIERNLQEDLRALRQGIEEVEKVHTADEVAADLPPLTEETLDLVYQALQMPDPPTTEEKRLEKRRLLLLRGESKWLGLDELRSRAATHLADLSRRLNRTAFLATPSTMSERESHAASLESAVVETASQQHAQAGHASLTTSDPAMITAPTVLSQVEHVLSTQMQRTSSVSLSFLDKEDWKSLVRWSATTNDLNSIERTLKLMQQSHQDTLRMEVANVALHIFSREGAIMQCQLVAETMRSLNIPFDTRSTHFLVEAEVRANRLDSAMEMLSTLETREPASMATYTFVIEALLRRTDKTELQSKAWTLFRQMRLNAHPVPDAPLYTVMIRASAMGVPQPNSDHWVYPPSSPTRTRFSVRPRGKQSKVSDVERALDLFREMTTYYKIRPTQEAYTAIITACARRKDTYRKAIDVFQSMLEVERERIKADDSSLPSAAPERAAYNALLQGCARNGDLVRARWILAEMLRSSMALYLHLQKRAKEEEREMNQSDLRQVVARRPDEETLTVMFFTYATYQVKSPAHLRTANPSSTTPSSDGVTEDVAVSSDRGEEGTAVRARNASMESGSSTFGEVPPQTSAAVMREVNGLMNRIASDEGREDGLLSTVKPHGRMLSSYLTVVGAHAGKRSLQAIQAILFGAPTEDASFVDTLELKGQSLHERWDVPVEAETCAQALKACTRSKTRDEADALAARVWTLLKSLIDAEARGGGDDLMALRRRKRVNGDVISSCYQAMIENEARSLHVDKAMDLLREFIHLYPPPPPASHMHGRGATRDREDEPISSNRRPVLTFPDLELLHNRLVEGVQIIDGVRQRLDDVAADIALIKWADRAYGYATRPPLPPNVNLSVLSKR